MLQRLKKLVAGVHFAEELNCFKPLKLNPYPQHLSCLLKNSPVSIIHFAF